MIRRYLAELVGTFGVVFVPVAFAGSSAISGSRPDLLGAALASGIAVLAMIYAFGPISAAHFNPAVTLGFASAGRFPWRFVPQYIVSQVIGSVLAAGIAAALFGAGPGSHIPAVPGALARNLGTEIAISFLLMTVIIAVATDKRVSGTVPGLAIGFMVVAGVMIGGPVTGGSMNPARSLGPALFVGGAALSSYWIYLVGPSFGAVLGALMFERVRLEKEYAKGAPNEILEALEAVGAEK